MTDKWNREDGAEYDVHSDPTRSRLGFPERRKYRQPESIAELALKWGWSRAVLEETKHVFEAAEVDRDRLRDAVKSVLGDCVYCQGLSLKSCPCTIALSLVMLEKP